MTVGSYTAERGYTFMEILLVVAITGILAVVVFVAVSNAIWKARITQATKNAENLKAATELYFIDMGFYPPDTNRGADPGFTQPLPYFPDGGAPGWEVMSSDAHCPDDWQDIVAEQWRGPYLPKWPTLTPWGGKYDFNYWEPACVRDGCPVGPGIFVGIQRDYNNENPIPSSAEQKMLDLGYDKDGCLNGEAQLLLIKF